MSYSVDPEAAETKAIHELADYEDLSVLEVGCGDGRVTWRYAETAAAVVAIDLNHQKILEAIEQTPDALRSKISFMAADVNEVDLPPSSFDVAILSHSL